MVHPFCKPAADRLAFVKVTWLRFLSHATEAGKTSMTKGGELRSNLRMGSSAFSRRQPYPSEEGSANLFRYSVLLLARPFTVGWLFWFAFPIFREFLAEPGRIRDLADPG